MNILNTVNKYLEAADRHPSHAAAAASADAFQARLDPVTCAALKAVAAELFCMEAEWAAEGAKNARSDGERDAIEKLKARQALPTPMRTIIPVSAEPDFSTMSSEEFARFKRRRFGQ